MKKIIALAAVGIIALSGCTSTSPEEDAARALIENHRAALDAPDSDEVAKFKYAWNLQDADTQRQMCDGKDLSPEVMLDAYNGGDHMLTMVEFLDTTAELCGAPIASATSDVDYPMTAFKEAWALQSEDAHIQMCQEVMADSQASVEVYNSTATDDLTVEELIRVTDELCAFVDMPVHQELTADDPQLGGPSDDGWWPGREAIEDEFVYEVESSWPNWRSSYYGTPAGQRSEMISYAYAICVMFRDELTSAEIYEKFEVREEDIGHVSSVIRIPTEDNLDVLIAASSGVLCPGWQGGREGHPQS